MRLTVTCPHCHKGSEAMLNNGDRVRVVHNCVARELGVQWQGMPGSGDFALYVEQNGELRPVEKSEPIYQLVVRKLLDGRNRFAMEFEPKREVV